MRQLCKGNVAVVKGAVLAGCRAYYGYPITPASEIAEYAALLPPKLEELSSRRQKRSCLHQHGLRRSGSWRPRDDRLFWSRSQPDAGRHVVPRWR